MNTQLKHITNRIIERSRSSREKYLIQMEDAIQNKVNRASLSCGNLAHAFAKFRDEIKKCPSACKVYSFSSLR